MSNAYDRYPEIDSILRQALEGSRGDRDALVADRCGEDEALREEIDRLLVQIDSGGTLDPVFRLSSEFLTHSQGRTMIGTSLSHYQITAKLGEGGMGEVYRATDTKLGRDVAIKVLPRGFADDRERVSRFEREAKVLASLNHPRIAQVHGFDQDGETHFIVMELAKGETLADRIRRGPLAVDEATAIALQIAEALEAAHEQGVVHRDLKPGNINAFAEVSTAPEVKVLDFGLAKLMAPPASSGADLTNSPTLTQPTAAGVLMGTAAYMSPEQARGQEADARSDIWAFGCVLYEMLTGRRAFEGNSVSDTLAAVLKEEPDLDRIPAEVDTALQRLLSRCLMKEPRQRWHHIADVRFGLEERDLGSDDRPPDQPDSDRMGTHRPSLAVGLIGFALGVFGTWFALRGSDETGEPPRGPFHVEVDAPLPGNGYHIITKSLAISPDGQRLAVAGRGAESGLLYVREAHEQTWRALPNTRDGHSPVFSPDGQRLIYKMSGPDGELMRSSFDGGATESVGLGGTALRINGRWAPRDSEGVLHEVEAGDLDGMPRACDDVVDLCTSFRGIVAAVTADSAVICKSTDGRSDLWLSRTGEQPSLLVGDGCFPEVFGSRLLFLRGSELWAARLTSMGEIEAGPVPTGIEVFHDYYYNGLGHWSLAKDGTLFYLEGTPESELWRIDRDGRKVGLIPMPSTIPGGSSVQVKASPDGRRALVAGNQVLRIVSLDSGEVSRPVNRMMVGAWLDDDTFAVGPSEKGAIEVRDWQARLLRTMTLPAEFLRGQIDAAVPDESAVIGTFYEVRESYSQGVYFVDLTAEKPPRVWVDTLRNFDRFADLSRNGQWIAWEQRIGRGEVQLSRWQDSPEPFPVSTAGGNQPRWSKDSRTLYFVDAERSWLMAVDLRPDEVPPFTPARKMFPIPEGTIFTQFVAYDTLPNGEFLFAIAKRPMRHRLIFDWLAEVDEKLAAAN